MDFRFDDSQIHPAIREAADLHGQIAQQASASLSKQLDDEMRVLLDRLAPGWTLESVGGRLRWQTEVRRPGVETLLLDGEPVLELQPPTMSEVYDKRTDSFTQTFSRDVKRFR